MNCTWTGTVVLKPPPWEAVNRWERQPFLPLHPQHFCDFMGTCRKRVHVSRGSGKRSTVTGCDGEQDFMGLSCARSLFCSCRGTCLHGEMWLVPEVLKKSRCCTCRCDDEVLLEPCWSNDREPDVQPLPMQRCQQQGKEQAGGTLEHTCAPGLHSELERADRPYGKLRGWQSRAQSGSEVPASPHCSVWLQGEKTSEKGKMKLF